MTSAQAATVALLDAVAAQLAAGDAKRDAVDLRVDVLERHRADWHAHRAQFPLRAVAADFEVGKSAKISAEMLTLRQKAERIAYGMDEAVSVELGLRNPWGRYLEDPLP